MRLLFTLAVLPTLAAQVPSQPVWFLGPPYTGRWTVSFEADGSPGVVLSITSEPSDAEVFLNDFRAGVTPLNGVTRPLGGVHIRVRKAGYQESSVLLNALQEGRYTLRVGLETAFATLHLRDHQTVGQLRVNDEERELAEMVRIAPGPNRVLLRRFGYRDHVFSISAEPERVYEVAPEWVPAPFDVVARPPTRGRINPNLPGPLGRFSWTVQVSGPGTAVLAVYPEGSTEAVDVRTLPEFTTWEQTIEWVPSVLVPDGEYRAVLSARGRDEREVTREARLVVDRSLRFSPTSGWLGPSFLPPETAVVGTYLGLSLSTPNTFLLMVDARFPLQGWEPQFRIGARVSPGSSELYGGGRLLLPDLVRSGPWTVFWGLEGGASTVPVSPPDLFELTNAAVLTLGTRLWLPGGPFVTLDGRVGWSVSPWSPLVGTGLGLGWAETRHQLGLSLSYQPFQPAPWVSRAWLHVLVLDTSLSLGLNGVARFTTWDDRTLGLLLSLVVTP